MDAGTHLRWTSTRLPVTAALEYRSERFTVAGRSTQRLDARALAERHPQLAAPGGALAPGTGA